MFLQSFDRARYNGYAIVNSDSPHPVVAETELVWQSSGHPAQPQVKDGIKYWAKDWGITREQCLALLQDLRADHTWNALEGSIHDLVETRIIPWTRGKGIGYALLLNQEEPKSVGIMISHCWAENALEFLDAVCRSTKKGDVMFICAFSLYQCEDSLGPSINQQLGSIPSKGPFQQVLQHIKGTDEAYVCNRDDVHRIFSSSPFVFFILSVISLWLPAIVNGSICGFQHCALRKYQHVEAEGKKVYVWVWSDIEPFFLPCVPGALGLLLVFAVVFVSRNCLLPRYMGMIVVPNRSVDIYSRLWCVFEIFCAGMLEVPVRLAHTMARAGHSQGGSRAASCSKMSDTTHIHNEIEGCYEGGFDQVDEHIQKVTYQERWTVAYWVFRWGFPVVLFCLAWYRMYDRRDCRVESLGDTFGTVLVIGGLVVSFYMVFKKGQGRVSALELFILLGIQGAIACIFELLRWLTFRHKTMYCYQLKGTQLFFDFVHGFAETSRLGMFVASAYTLIILAWSFLSRGPVPFLLRKRELAAMTFLGMSYIVLRIFFVGPRLSWTLLMQRSQFAPELFFVFTELAALFGCPLQFIVRARLYWGLTVTWTGFCVATEESRSPSLTERSTGADTSKAADGGSSGAHSQRLGCLR